MNVLGIVPESSTLAERMWFIPEYALLAPGPRALAGRKMELYAALVENLDYHVGRLIDHLKAIGEYENMVFIVFGDNGAEGTDLAAAYPEKLKEMLVLWDDCGTKMSR